MTKYVQRFERNQTGRDLIVGDIHGHFTKLQAALDAVGLGLEIIENQSRYTPEDFGTCGNVGVNGA